MVAEFKNKDFALAGLGPGEAEDWTLSAFLQLPGWAKFRTYGGFLLSETFDWFDSYAKQWSGVEPFALDEVISITIANVGIDPLNYFEVSGDVRRVLPPSACFQVVGTVPGQTNLDAYWTVASIEFNGTLTRIYVTEAILADVPAVLRIPPIVHVNIDNYGWGAALVSQASYPVGPLAPGDTLLLSINRGASQTITFVGGETSAQDVVDLLNSQFLTLGIDDLVYAAVESTAPVIRSYEQAAGKYLAIKGGTVAHTLSFPDFEQFGFGQFAQLFDIYFEDIANASAEEVGGVLKQYVYHGYFRARESESGGNVLVRSEKAGELASCQVWGYNGDLTSAASWPIPARTPANNELYLEVDGVSFTATLTVGATTAEELKEAFELAFQTAGVTGVADIDEDGQIIIGALLSIKVTGGSANAALNFPVNVASYGNNKIHSLLGFTSAVSVGVYDVGFFESFDDVNAFAANFARGTSVESQWETFEWSNVFASLDETRIVAAPVKSWADYVSAEDIIAVSVAPTNTFRVIGDKRDAFFAGIKAVLVDSTGNDGAYTVTGSVFTPGYTGHTDISVAEDILDGTADGKLYPHIFGDEIEDFEQAWLCEFLTNPNDPPHRFRAGVIVGDAVTFPIKIPANRNEMWIYVATETNLIRIRVDVASYETAADLVANMNAKFSAVSSAALEFSVHEESDDGTSAKIGFGWNGSGFIPEEFYFANQHGQYEALDIRETIGLANLSGPTGRIAVPSRYFAKVEGASHSTEKRFWADDPIVFDVDPDSRVSYSVVTTAALETVVVPEGQLFAFFNQVASPANSANEAFIPEGWGGSILDQAAFEATLSVAVFDQSLTPQNFEDFEEGW